MCKISSGATKIISKSLFIGLIKFRGALSYPVELYLLLKKEDIDTVKGY